MEIRVYDRIDGITKLGPGTRYGLWTQGCCRKCKGCMSPNSQSLDGGYVMDAEKLAEEILKSGRNELTISGGEPFLQAQALVFILDFLRKERDMGVIIYSGYAYEEILEHPDSSYRELLNRCDLLVDGAYIEALNDGKNLRGSANQRAIPITERYREFAGEFGTRPAEVEFFMDEKKYVMVGVPSPQLLKKIKKLTI